MYGIFVAQIRRRPASKKEIRELLAAGTCNVALEATSLFGNEYSGDVCDAPDGDYTFVGPDPYTSRKFYGTIVKRGDKVTVK